MRPKANKKVWILSIAWPVAYAVLVRYVYDMKALANLPGVMSIGFLLFVPFVVGFLTIAFSDTESIGSRRYCVFMPWFSNIVFAVVTMLLQVEGWACWVMALPVFFVASSLGGLIARRYILSSEDRNDRLNISIVMLLPFLAIPIEKQFPPSAFTYKTYTYIDIQAADTTIWNNLVRVRTITPEEDHSRITRFLRMPRPVRAELDYLGIGGSRQAIFTGGLVFREVVSDYQPNRKMTFGIKANPYDIPSTTMDKHIVIGGEFFDVLDGTYELQPLGNNRYRLHLYSHFSLKTTFNFYANIWAGWIMKDIQNNILQVIRTRSQANL